MACVVRSFTKNSKKLMGVCALAIVLVLWLSISFWKEAYSQRKDAVQLQKSIVAEDALIAHAQMLATERSTFSSLYFSNEITKEQLNQWRTLIDATNLHSTQIVSKIKKLRSDSSLESRFRYNELSLYTKLDQFYKIHQRLDVYRSYLLEQLTFPSGSRDPSMHGYMFVIYSDLIQSANELRLRTFFSSRKNNKDVTFLEDLKNSIWTLSESSRQIFSLLNGYIESTESSVTNTADNATLQTSISQQHERVEQSLSEIVEISKSSNLDKELIAQVAEVNQWYRGHYRNTKMRLINAVNSQDPPGVSSRQWQNVSNELYALTEVLGELTASKALASARAVEKRAVLNLAIDTLLVVLCMIMGGASLIFLKRVHHQANHDDLTDLPNRRHFNELLEHAIHQADATQDQVILMSVDLDGFKTINDTMGHGVGDKLLVLVAERLKYIADNRKLIARMGGDEFSVLFTTRDENEAARFAEQIQDNLAPSFIIDEGVVHIGASIGYCAYPDHAETAKQLQISSDLAMFSAKQDGRNCIRKFDAEMSADFEFRLHTEKDLVNAIDDNQFELHYQPQFNLTLNKVDAVEALIRWNHPKRGPVSPVEFIPVAEDSGLIPQIGEWVLDEACRQTAYWVNVLNIPIRVAINVSIQQIMQPEFVDMVLDTLKRHQLNSRFVELEVTESEVTANVEWVVQSLLLLRQAGIKIALDDFGTGYSSLSQLQELPINTLKIDRSFISRLEDSSSTSNSVAQTIAALARAYDLETVAEGVESEHQLAQVSGLGIDVVQGYYYSKPVCSADIPATVAAINDSAINDRKAA